MPNPSIDIVILRHGEAEPFEMRDEQRALTDYGRSRARQQAELLSDSGFVPTEIVHSPYVRTTQTAEICQTVFQAPEMRSDHGLLHSAHPEQVPFILEGATTILLVSHMPLVGRLIQYLCPRSEIYGLPVAGFVRLKTDLSSLTSELIYDGRA